MKREPVSLKRIAAGVLSCLRTANDLGYPHGAGKKACCLFFDAIKVNVVGVEMAVDWMRSQGYVIEDDGRRIKLIKEPK